LPVHCERYTRLSPERLSRAEATGCWTRHSWPAAPTTTDRPLPAPPGLLRHAVGAGRIHREHFWQPPGRDCLGQSLPFSFLLSYRISTSCFIYGYISASVADLEYAKPVVLVLVPSGLGGLSARRGVPSPFDCACVRGSASCTSGRADSGRKRGERKKLARAG